MRVYVAFYEIFFVERFYLIIKIVFLKNEKTKIFLLII